MEIGIGVGFGIADGNITGIGFGIIAKLTGIGIKKSTGIGIVEGGFTPGLTMGGGGRVNNTQRGGGVGEYINTTSSAPGRPITQCEGRVNQCFYPFIATGSVLKFVFL